MRFQEIYNLPMHQCGLFIDQDYLFLGRSPDGLLEEDTIIEIKYPQVLVKLSPEEGIAQKKVNSTKIANNKLYLNRNRNYYYQVAYGKN